ncbi:MAG: PIN domain-containing protein [Clostridia bacterium]|nr:PIN domain-containing protein [Clostridia bacterium]
MRVLIDTCVILDTLQAREPFNKESDQIFIHIANMHISAFVTPPSTTDIYYLMHRFNHDKVKTANTMLKLFDYFNVLDTFGRNCKEAILKVGDYEDNLIIETAQSADIDCIVTRNIKDFENSVLPVFTPSEFLAQSIFN